MMFEGADGFERFLGQRFYCQAGDVPGFRGVTTGDGPLIQCFTSEVALARQCGAVPWFSTVGADLIALVPAGYLLIVDQGSDNAVILDPSATRRAVRFGSAPS